jgi:uncharacterized protein
MKPRCDWETYDAPFEIKSLNDAGELEGYAAVFGNEDKGSDVIEPGAFTKTIQESPDGVPILYQHDTYEPIGVSTKLEEDRYGLAVKGQLNMDVQRARETRSLLNQKAMKGLSIGYKTVKYANVAGVRRLKELGLKEFSPVTFPMNELAIASVKAAGDVIWDPEYGYNDLRDDLRAQINPGPGVCNFWVQDVSLDQTHAIVQDYNSDQTWVVPFTMNDDGDPVVAPSSDWIEAEQAWVQAEDGKSLAPLAGRLLGVKIEEKAGRMFSAANLAALKDAHDKISALLDLAKPAAATSDDDEAAGKALEPAAATLRDIANDLKQRKEARAA